jgi:hypothetical protein
MKDATGERAESAIGLPATGRPDIVERPAATGFIRI